MGGAKIVEDAEGGRGRGLAGQGHVVEDKIFLIPVEDKPFNQWEEGELLQMWVEGAVHRW